MDGEIASKHRYATGPQTPPRQKLPPDGSAGVAVLRLTRRVSLMLALLLSLGLWAAIWAVVASLASAVLG